jgi:hypothetical protein
LCEVESVAEVVGPGVESLIGFVDVVWDAFVRVFVLFIFWRASFFFFLAFSFYGKSKRAHD